MKQMEKNIIQEEILIEAAKVYFKEKGFKKKNKRWTKDIGDFTLSFYIQGSSYDKEDYYIRPGIFINALSDPTFNYGHFYIEIDNSDIHEVFKKTEKFFTEWTDKPLIKKRTLSFIEWRKEYTREYRENTMADKLSFPCDFEPLLSCDKENLCYIIENF